MPTLDLSTSFTLVVEIPFNAQNIEDLQEFSNSLVAINRFYVFVSGTQNEFPILPELISLDIHSFPKLKLKVSATWLAIFLTFTANYDKFPENLEKMKNDAKAAAHRVIQETEWAGHKLEYYVDHTAEALLEKGEHTATEAAKALRAARESLSRDGEFKISATEDHKN